MGAMLADTCGVSLPGTGADVAPFLAIAVVLVLTGAAVLVWRRRSRRSVATSTLALLAVLSCFAISGDGSAEAADCVGSASATTTTLVASSPGVVTTTTVAATTSTTSTSSTLAEEATSTTAVTTTVVGSDPVPPVEVPEVPVPALLGVGGAVVFFGYALLERRRRLA